MSLSWTDENAKWNPAKAPDLTVHQQAAAEAIFETFQEVRRQKGQNDPDSPGKLTWSEGLTIALTKGSVDASAVENLLDDEVNDAQDVAAVGQAVFAQLFPSP